MLRTNAGASATQSATSSTSMLRTNPLRYELMQVLRRLTPYEGSRQFLQMYENKRGLEAWMPQYRARKDAEVLALLALLLQKYRY